MSGSSKITILYEDKELIVCIKPAGIATQSRRISEPDMVSLLKNHISENKKTGTEPYLALIHRLDQPVSGILVFGKSKKAAAELNEQLMHGEFGKHYRALITGMPSKTEAVLEDYMVKDQKGNVSRICRKHDKDAKFARLTYKIVGDSKKQLFSDIKSRLHESDVSTTELDITLDTGRHHQIRLQLSNIGCPIVGDGKYTNIEERQERTGKRLGTKIKLPLCLCAYCLDFTHPVTGEKMHYELDRHY